MRGIAAWALGCAVVVGAVAFIAPPSAATYLPDERVATDDALYRDLERLTARSGTIPRFLSTRPLRRAEALAYLDGLALARPEIARDPAYLRARRALDSAAAGGMPPLVTASAPDGEAVEFSPYVSLRYADDPRGRPDIDRDYRIGGTLSAALDSSVTAVADLYAGTASQGGRGTPNFGTFNALVEGVDFNTWVKEAYVEARLGRLRALAGHAWLRWGPGQEGTLALSDAAPALDMIRGELTVLRSWRAQWFVSLLDPGPQAYLAGHRIEWSPRGGRLTAGLTELARFDGTSQALLYWMPLVPYSFWEKRPKTAAAGAIPGDTTGVALAKNNVLWSADVAWAPREGWRAWGELLIDDISFSRDYKPDMIGYQAGVERRAPARGGRDALGISFEYTRVNNYTYSAFHGHEFAHEGFPIGFALGPDVASLAGEVSYERGAAWEFRARADWRKKGEGRIGDFWQKSDGEVDAAAFAGTPEREWRAGATAIYAPTRALRAEVGIGTSDFDHYRHGTATRSTAPIHLAARVSW